MQSWHSQRKKKSRRRAPAKTADSALAAFCLQVVDASLIGILFVAPYFFGGRHALGRFVFIGLASTAGVAWFAHQALLKQVAMTRTWAQLLSLASLLLVGFQLVPLPTHWLEQLAPRNVALLTLWNNTEGAAPQLGDWQTVSMAPSSTKIALATLIAYVMTFFAALGRLRERTDIERLVRMIALSAIVMGGFGILQYLTSNGLFFWFYEYPYSTTSQAAKGSFTTRNHFAHFLALGAGPLFAWIVWQIRYASREPMARHRVSQLRQNLTVIALHLGMGIVAMAGLLSISRGGIVALLTAYTLTVVLFCRRKLLSGSYLYGLALLGLIVVGLLSISESGYDRIAHRLDDLTSGSVEELDSREGRRKIWAANGAAIQAGGLFGSGAGTHREIYPIYLPQSPIKEYTHAENGYLQVGTENGLLGLGLLLLAIAMVASWCWQALRGADSEETWVLAVAVTAGLTASLVHSVVDFVWFVPACMSMTLLLAASALRLAQLTGKEHRRLPQASAVWPRTARIGLATSAFGTAVWAITCVLGPALASTHWDKYLLTSASPRPSGRLASHESSQDAAADELSRTEVMIYHLQRTLARDAESPRARLRLAGKYLQLFDQRQQFSDNAMSIDQIRDAAIASHFSSSQDLRNWLSRALGKNCQLLYKAHYHARQAIARCPLQGEGYLQLAKLCFLEGQAEPAIDAYLQQSVQVRPYDGGVLFEAGRQRLLLGQAEQGFGLWQQIYGDRGTHQKQIMQVLVGQLPAASFLELFEPNWSTLHSLWLAYREQGTREDWQSLVDYTSAQAENGRTAKNTHQEAHIRYALAEMHRALDHPQQALQYLQQANELAPNVYAFRRSLGRALLHAKQYPLAATHLRWCLARRPENETLQTELIEAKKSRLPQTAIRSLDRSRR